MFGLKPGINKNQSLKNKKVMATKKKGDYRVLVQVEIIEEFGLYKKGATPEMHPVLAKRLIAQSVAKAYVPKKTPKE